MRKNHSSGCKVSACFAQNKVSSSRAASARKITQAILRMSQSPVGSRNRVNADQVVRNFDQLKSALFAGVPACARIEHPASSLLPHPFLLMIRPLLIAGTAVPETEELDMANTATWGFQRVHEFLGWVRQSWECDVAGLTFPIKRPNRKKKAANCRAELS